MGNKSMTDGFLNCLTRRSATRILLTGAGLLGGAHYLVAGALARPARSAFEWHPERAPAGPLAIIVSLTRQRVFVYRNGIQIGASPCSTGKKGHETPTGVFTIVAEGERALFEHL